MAEKHEMHVILPIFFEKLLQALVFKIHYECKASKTKKRGWNGSFVQKLFLSNIDWNVLWGRGAGKT